MAAKAAIHAVPPAKRGAKTKCPSPATLDYMTHDDMAADPENLLLVYLRLLDGKLIQVTKRQRDDGPKFTALELAISNQSAIQSSRV